MGIQWIAIGVATVGAAMAIVAFALHWRERQLHRQTREERDELLPYRAIPDARAEAQRIQAQAQEQAQVRLASAQATLEQAQGQAQTTVTQGQVQAGQILEEARQQALQMVSQAEQALAQSHAEAGQVLDAARTQAVAKAEEALRREHAAMDEAERLVADAQAKAQEIAGDALRARDKADVYKQAARAMRNTVEGYGDHYLVPPQSVLDDLADAFDHKEAGKKLKEARGITRQMVQEGRAALCDYKEDRRRVNAIRFVTDAFNGKVDSILSKVKHNNVGTLEQKIRDAFAQVNLGGQAFKGARIREEYLQARLDELLWAVRAMELQRREREEQKKIKEQLREEERARKEYEKAIREAEKEEKMLEKAMAKARKQLASASETKRQEYEQKLAELEQKVRDAEAKNQRALSMAQQTRRGHVYVISNVGSFGEDVYKIGLTRRLEPLDRVKELGDASVPFSFDVHAMIWAEDAPALETELHHQFQQAQVNKVNPRKEFFRLRLQQIREVVEAKGFDVHWTMLAEAKEYRESKAMERRPSGGVGGLSKAPEFASVSRSIAGA